MMIKYECPKCGTALESPSSMAGQEDQCPLCKHTCTVPERKTGRRVFIGSCVGGGLLLAVALTVVLVPWAREPRSGSGDTPQAQPASPPVVSDPLRREQPSNSEPVVSTQPAVAEGTQPPKGSSEPGKAPQGAPLSPEQVFERASPAVVYIVVRDRHFKPIGLGSGFFVDAKGLIVTNYHVIKGAEFATARLNSGATLIVDGVTATDPDADLALLKVSGGGFAFLKNAEGPLPRIGTTVYAIGNPRGLENTFSEGMVSGHREIKEGLTAIQVTTPISRGSSGGPLLNASGEAVGVTTAYLTGGQNLNFAVPVAAVRRLTQRQGKVQTLASAGGGRLEQAETEELDKAWDAMADQDWGAASEILTTLRTSQADNALVWDALRYLHRKLGNHEITIEHWKTGRGAEGQAWLNSGIKRSKEGRYSDAIESFKGAVSRDPDRGEAYYMMATIYMLQSFKGGEEKYSEAVEAYKKAIALGLKPKPAPAASAHYGIGTAYQYLKKYSEAIEAFKMVIIFETPADAAAFFEMGWCYEELGDPAAALAAYQMSLRREPAGRYAGVARRDIRRLGGVPGQRPETRPAVSGP